jgi:hypothetical protein
MRRTIPLFLLAVGLFGACAAPPAPGDPVASGEPALQAFERLSREQARIDYEAMDTATRALLWRAQIERTLASGPVTEAQRDLLVEMHADMEGSLTARADEMEKRLLAVSSPEDAERLVGTLGDPALRAPDEARQGRSVRAPCSSNWTCWNDCRCEGGLGGPQICYMYSCSSNCTQTSGCGFLNLGTCTGITTQTETSCD